MYRCITFFRREKNPNKKKQSFTLTLLEKAWVEMEIPKYLVYILSFGSLQNLEKKHVSNDLQALYIPRLLTIKLVPLLLEAIKSGAFSHRAALDLTSFTNGKGPRCCRTGARIINSQLPIFFAGLGRWIGVSLYFFRRIFKGQKLAVRFFGKGVLTPKSRFATCESGPKSLFATCESGKL